MDRELKHHQPPMTVDEQIQNLKSIGLIINDEAYAKSILNDISYFRLIKAYSLNLKQRNGSYNNGVTFEHIVNLYLFNANLRQLLYKTIEHIEVNLRCRIANYFANTYGVLEYKDAANFENEDYHKAFLDDINEEISRNSKAPFVKNFRENYDDGELPIYALIELFSFGTMSKFYKNMKNTDKKAISNSFGVGYSYFESWIENIAYVRNICAHYGRLYNAIMTKSPKLYKQYIAAGIRNNRLFATLLCMKHILVGSKQWKEFVFELEQLTNKYSNIDITSMGFPENWLGLLSSSN